MKKFVVAMLLVVSSCSYAAAEQREGVWLIVAAAAGCDGAGEPPGLLEEVLHWVRAGYVAEGGTADGFDRFLVDYTSAISTEKQPKSVCFRDR